MPDSAVPALEGDEWLAEYAPVSLVHLRAAGTEVHLQHGTRMLARADTVLGNAPPARGRSQAKEHLAEAKKVGETIQDAEDRQIFLDDFEGGEWWGIR